MRMSIESIVQKEKLDRSDIVALLSADGSEKEVLFNEAVKVMNREVGSKVYFRGLIEFSNICGKDCFYCGIRRSNKEINRYNLTDNQILEAARIIHENNFGSIILQSGELDTPAFTTRIEKLLREIKKLSEGKLGITLSLGEQSRDVYRRWFDAGAHRYLLRI
jgi:biotin synthase